MYLQFSSFPSSFILNIPVLNISVFVDYEPNKPTAHQTEMAFNHLHKGLLSYPPSHLDGRFPVSQTLTKSASVL